MKFSKRTTTALVSALMLGSGAIGMAKADCGFGFDNSCADDDHVQGGVWLCEDMAALAPEAFSGMIQRSDTGWQVMRLPARDDPMLARIERIRNQEYLFCDTIDEQYVDMAHRVALTYRLWRAATLEQTQWLERYQKRAAARAGSAGDSEFTRMQAEYAAYRSFRIQEQALFELAEAFGGEARPTVIRTQDQVIRLEGTLDTQYDTWRGLLRDIYLIETGGQLP